MSHPLAHVFRGEIEVQSSTQNGQPARTVRLRNNEAVQVEKREAGGTTTIEVVLAKPADAVAFVRVDQLRKIAEEARPGSFRRWRAYSQELRKDPSLVADHTFESAGANNTISPNLWQRAKRWTPVSMTPNGSGPLAEQVRALLPRSRVREQGRLTPSRNSSHSRRLSPSPCGFKRRPFLSASAFVDRKRRHGVAASALGNRRGWVDARYQLQAGERTILCDATAAHRRDGRKVASGRRSRRARRVQPSQAVLRRWSPGG